MYTESDETKEYEHSLLKQTMQSFAIRCTHKWKTDTANLVIMRKKQALTIFVTSTSELDIAKQIQ